MSKEKNKKAAKDAPAVETKNLGGRPSRYKEEYCEDLIKHMERGFSYESFAGAIGVHRDTLYAWEKVHGAFSDAKKTALEANLYFWEQQGIDGLYNVTEYNEDGKPTKSKSINSTIWIFNMKNRHQWRDKQKDETDVVVNNNNVTGLSDEEIDRKIEEKLGKK